MSSRHFKVVTTCALALLFPAAIPQIGRAQSTGGQGNQQAISQTGLLPVYGVDFDFDPSWVDKAEFPPTSAVYPNYGTNAVFQKVWDALKPGGFNAIRFPVDVRDDKSAVNEIANLCVWAKNSAAHLVPVLIGCDLGQAPGPQYPGQAAKVVAAVVAALEKGASQNLQAYTQILCYQIENELNHAGLHGPGSPQSSRQLLLSAAAAVRKAEQDALKGSGLNATPLAINASFDYELINTGAIAGATLGDAAYSQAYDSTKRFLAALAASTDIDAVSIDWFPGSISAGTVDRFPALLHSLEADLPGKQIVLTTGFSTGFHSADEQKNFYALAFANLADYRAHEGISSPFAGLFFHGALNGAEANPSPPFADLPAGVSAWDWPARAAELKRMWNGNGTSDAVAWWLKKVTNSMGLASLSLDSSGSATVAIQPAAVGLSQIASSVSQGNTNAAASTGVNSTTASSPSGELAGSAVSTAQVPAGANSQGPAAVNPQSPSGAMAQTPGFGQSLAAELEKGLLGLMDHVFERVGSLIGGGGSGSGAAQYNPTQQSSQLPGGPSFGPGGGARLSISLSRQDVTIQPSIPQAGRQATFSVTLRNQSPDADASGLVVALTDEAASVLSQVTDVSVARNSAQTVTALWTPSEPRLYRVTARVTDSTLNELASASLDPLNVTGGENSGSQAMTGSPADKGPRNTNNTKLSAGLGAPQMQALTVGSQGQPVIAGQPSGVTVRVANPYTNPIADVDAKLVVDGKPTQARNIGSLLPHQSRSLLFSDVQFSQSGNHQVAVVVEAHGTRNRKATAATEVTVLKEAAQGSSPSPRSAQPGGPSSVRSILHPAVSIGKLSVATGQQTAGIRAVNPTQPPVRQIQGGQGAASSGKDRPGHQDVLNPAQGTAPPQPPVRPFNQDLKSAPHPQPAGPRPGGQSAPVLTVSGSEIRYTPAHPQAKEPIEFVIPVHNTGRTDASRARIGCTIVADGKTSFRKEFDAEIKAGQVYIVRLGTETPPAREIVLEIIVGADGAGEHAVSRASIAVGVAVDPPRRR